MAVITVSRGSYSRGKEVSEKVAQRLGYECIEREVLLEASEEFHIPEIKLLHAIEDVPSIFNRFTHGKARYIAYIQAALLEHLQRDNVVYHGFAGHFFVKEIPHVLKVRILADMEDRVRIVMERDRISRDESFKFIEDIDEQRRRWSRHLYGIDTSDPNLYDIVLNLHELTVADSVDIICRTTELKSFQMTDESQKAINDLALSAKVKAALISKKSDIEISADNGVVHISAEIPLEQESQWAKEIERIAKAVPGVEEVKIHLRPLTLIR